METQTKNGITWGYFRHAHRRYSFLLLANLFSAIDAGANGNCSNAGAGSITHKKITAHINSCNIKLAALTTTTS